MDPLNARYVVTAVRQESNNITAVDQVPPASPLTPLERRPSAITAQRLTGGNDGLTNIGVDDYVGNESLGNGLHAFDPIDAINIVAVPEAVDRNVHIRGMAYCENRRDCFYVAEAPEAAATADEVLNFKLARGLYSGGNAFNSKYGALYTPWIRVFDPRTASRITIPPSGAVAGRYARTDSTRGVHKAPAGVTDGRVATALDLAVQFSTADQEKLNPKGVNVIRRFSGAGNVVWGARTVSTDPEWRLLNVRRLFLFLEESIEESTSWAVFEPNDPTLWKALARNVSAFLRLQWLAGALVGATEEEAFFVKCDEETNPPESVLLGRVITEIGVAPSKPAEFVIFRIAQFQGGAEVSE
jgi:phage tail sheath protein FI